jgi:cyclic beta-1,2-glucan synthetase
LVRRCITGRNLLEWESMAQSEAGSHGRMSLVSLYLLLCPAVATGISFFAARAQTGYELLPISVLLLWAATPLAAEFVSRRVLFHRARDVKDTRFLRELSLETWHYFVDFANSEEHWLIPDNVQFDPHALAARTSPTNIGLQLVADIAAGDFGYLTQAELAMRLGRVFTVLDGLDRDRGHFYNWYDTRTLQPLQPRYISAVDSGNLAASLITVKQGCLDVLQSPLLSPGTLEGLRDHCRRLKGSLPHSSRSAPVMQKIVSLVRQLDYQPSDLFSWAGQLDELRKMGPTLTDNIAWLCEHAQLRKGESCEETRYWLAAFNDRVRAWMEFLTQFTPWVTGALGREVRMSSADPRLTGLMKILGRIPTLNGLPEYYESINQEIRSLLLAGDVMPAARRTLEDLGGMLNTSRRAADELRLGFEQVAGYAHLLAEEMDFRFLLNASTNLIHIGFNVETGTLDDSHYDLLASEARTAVFVGVAKGDLPRESWFRLGRKLTTYQGHRALLSWSGTMFEYLMPCLFLRNFEDSLLGASVAGAVRIQQLYCRAKRFPWGVSEAAYNARDAASNYQYRAFGIPALGLSKMSPEDFVVAPYASMLALMVDPRGATANLRHMAERGWSGRYGFYESIDYIGRRPVLVRAYMVHHQGMALLALANSLLENVIQKRFHAEPMVLATQLLLQERLPALVADNEAEDQLQLAPEQPRPMVVA